MFASTHELAIDPFKSVASQPKFPIFSLQGPCALDRGAPRQPAMTHWLPVKLLRWPAGNPPPLMQFVQSLPHDRHTVIRCTLRGYKAIRRADSYYNLCYGRGMALLVPPAHALRMYAILRIIEDIYMLPPRLLGTSATWSEADSPIKSESDAMVVLIPCRFALLCARVSVIRLARNHN